VIDPRLLQKLHQACSIESRRGHSLPGIRLRIRDFLAGLPADAGWDLAELAGRALFAIGFSDDGEPDLLLPAVTAIDAFLRSVVAPYPRREALEEQYPRLRELARRPDVREEDLIAWYRQFLAT